MSEPKTLFDFLLEARREVEAERQGFEVINFQNERKRRLGMSGFTARNATTDGEVSEHG